MVKWRLRLNENGFSLIELISAILVMGIIAAVVFPSFKTSGIDVSTAASTLETDLHFLQELAMARNPQNTGDIGVTFTSGQSSYTITDPASMFGQTRTFPSGVTISSATSAISFNKYGEPEIAGATAVVQLSSGTDVKSITIERYTGRITIS